MNAETNTSVARLARNVSTVTFQAGTILRSRPPTPLRLHSGNESHRRDLSVPHRIARACTTHVQRRAGQNRPPGQYGSRARPIISNNCSTSIIAPSIHQYYTPRFTSQTDAKIIFKLSSAPPPVLPRSTLYECIPFDFFFFFSFFITLHPVPAPRTRPTSSSPCAQPAATNAKNYPISGYLSSCGRYLLQGARERRGRARTADMAKARRLPRTSESPHRGWIKLFPCCIIFPLLHSSARWFIKICPGRSFFLHFISVPSGSVLRPAEPERPTEDEFHY